MNAQQVADIMNAVNALPRGVGKRLTSFESGTGSDWVTWREHFDATRLINDWQDERARRELKAAMLGEAARLTSDIAIDGAGVNLDAVLAAYAGRFLPAAAGQVARVEFHAAFQRPDETVLQFHGRCREMFLRAYPDQAPNNSVLLIQTFALGLADTEVSRFVLDQNPATFAAASNTAQVKSATEAALSSRRKGGVNSINSMGAGKSAGGGDKSCWHCNRPGHLRAECAEYLRVQLREQRARGNSNFIPRGGRKQAGKRTKGGSRQFQGDSRRGQINSIEEPNQDAGLDSSASGNE